LLVSFNDIAQYLDITMPSKTLWYLSYNWKCFTWCLSVTVYCCVFF